MRKFRVDASKKIQASQKSSIMAERYDYSDGERIGNALANQEIQIKDGDSWVRYAVTWREFVDSYLKELQEKGYETRVRTVNASKSIKSSSITAAREDEEFEDPRITEAEDLQDRVEDDFDYVMAGIERLIREGLLDEAISLMNTLSDTLDSAVNIIGNDFESGSDINPEEEI